MAPSRPVLSGRFIWLNYLARLGGMTRRGIEKSQSPSSFLGIGRMLVLCDPFQVADIEQEQVWSGFNKKALALELGDSAAGGFRCDAQHCTHVFTGEEFAFAALLIPNKTQQQAGYALLGRTG